MRALRQRVNTTAVQVNQRMTEADGLDPNSFHEKAGECPVRFFYPGVLFGPSWHVLRSRAEN